MLRYDYGENNFELSRAIPRCVELIIVGGTLDDVAALVGSNLLDFLSGNASVNAIGFESGTREDEGVGSDYTTGRNDGVVENSSTHTYQATVADRSPVDDGVMADGDVGTNVSLGRVRRAIEKGVEHGAILDVSTVADSDRIDVAAKNSTVPDTTIFTNCDVPDQDCRLGKERIGTNGRGLAPYFFNNCHEYFARLRNFWNLERRRLPSAVLRVSQFFSTWSVVRGPTSPKTWGWRWMSLSEIPLATSARVKAFCSEAILE